MVLGELEDAAVKAECTPDGYKLYDVHRSSLNFSRLLLSLIGSFSKPRRQRQRERHQTKGLMSRTIAVHVRFESLYISLPSSANQQHELTKFYVFWGTRTSVANLSYLLCELNAFEVCLA